MTTRRSTRTCRSSTRWRPSSSRDPPPGIITVSRRLPQQEVVAGVMTSPRPFVGRARELEELRASLDDAAAGRGRLVLVTGEPGIGKTRLLQELAGAAAERGWEVLTGRCWEGGGAPAYWPWI